MWRGEDDKKRLQEAFRLVCRKCGSDDVVVSIEHGIDYGGHTGYQEGTVSIGCNTCKQNDFYMSL